MTASAAAEQAPLLSPFFPPILAPCAPSGICCSDRRHDEKWTRKRTETSVGLEWFSGVLCATAIFSLIRLPFKTATLLNYASPPSLSLSLYTQWLGW